MTKEKHSCIKENLEFHRKRMRKCHDCSKPTFNFRCEECWREIRAKSMVWGDTILDDVSYNAARLNRRPV